MFDASVRFVLGDGRMIFFWEDARLGCQSIKTAAPALYSAVNERVKHSRTVGEAM